MHTGVEATEAGAVLRVRHAITRAVFAVRLHFARRLTTASKRLAIDLRRDSLDHTPDLELVTISFNNPTVVEAQYDSFRRNLDDSYRWIVADNSSDNRARRSIRSFCSNHDVPYLPLPRNPYTGRDPSKSHGEALTYVSRAISGATGARILGFLDHDVFPIRSTSIVDTMADADAYGWAQERSDVRYLWPGLLFLKREAVDPSVLDFSPWAGGDTGARLQEQVYEQLDGGQIRHMENEQRLFRPDSDEKCEVLDDWLHTVNASYWKDASPKEARILELISEYETQAQSQ